NFVFSMPINRRRSARRACFFFFKQKTAYEITTGDWSSDVCSSDLRRSRLRQRDLRHAQARAGERRQLPGDAEDGETVRAVRRDLDVEDVIVEAEIGDEVPSEGRVAVEDEDPRLVLRAESQLALGAEHPLGRRA